MNTAISAAGLYWELKGAWPPAGACRHPFLGPNSVGRVGQNSFGADTLGDSAREMARAIVHFR
jgi:hypothetical protein